MKKKSPRKEGDNNRSFWPGFAVFGKKKKEVVVPGRDGDWVNQLGTK